MAESTRDIVLETLRSLSRLEDDGPLVVSLYLDTRWGDGRRREAARLFVKNKIRQVLAVHPPEDGGADLFKDTEQIRRAVDEVLSPGSRHQGRGLVVFASTERQLWVAIPTPRPFENHLVVRRVPYLMPLARMADDFASALLCQVDSRSARVLEFVHGGLAGQSVVDSPEVPGRHQQGGWSQMRYQRHVDWLREKHVREAGDVFVRLADRLPHAQLFISGPHEPVTWLRAMLPKRVLVREPTTLGIDSTCELPGVVRAVLEGIEKRERNLERENVSLTLQEALSGGLAASGPGEVAIAANRGAILELLIHDDVPVSGWRCECSLLLGAGLSPKQCPGCDRGTVPCDLGERLVEKVYAAGGAVEVVREDSRLRDIGGVAARLRFGV